MAENDEWESVDAVAKGLKMIKAGKPMVHFGTPLRFPRSIHAGLSMHMSKMQDPRLLTPHWGVGWCDPKLRDGDGLAELSNLLKKSKTKGIDLEDQEIGDAGLEALSEGLKHNKSLVTLNLSGTTDIYMTF